ncbi:MAG: GrdX family protein [Synergistaceae bacterium]|nr:GrdX family protein [Synergistaceae bacterium]MBQ6739542.1 GrdX family protein [Synergistaceae bacterium]
MSKILLVSNNYELCKCIKSYEFIDGSAIDALIAVRDYVHQGGVILTHPLCGNLRPYQQPFRSVLLEIKNNILDLESLSLIEHAIEIYNSVKNINIKELSREHYADFSFIDAELMRESLNQFNLINNKSSWPRPAELLNLN